MSVSLLSRAAQRVAFSMLVQPLLTAGRAPSNPLVAPIFRWALRNRDAQAPRTHPLHSILQAPEWNSDFALSRGALLWLWRHLERQHPTAIVEFGSGRSTAMFALFARRQAAAGRPRPTVLSLEHDETWRRQTISILERFKLTDFVEVVRLPAKAASQSQGTFDIDPLKPRLQDRRFNLLLIDGPPASIGRDATFPTLAPYLAHGADIFLDDADRAHEREVLRQWLDQHSGRLSLKAVLPLTRSMAWMKNL